MVLTLFSAFSAFLADLKNSFLPQEILLSATAIPTLTYVYLALMISEGFCTLLWFLTLIGDQIQRIAEFSSVLDINDGNIVTGRNLALLLVCVFVIYPFLIPKSLKFQTLPGILSTMGSIVVVLIVIVMFKSSDRIQVSYYYVIQANLSGRNEPSIPPYRLKPTKMPPHTLVGQVFRILCTFVASQTVHLQSALCTRKWPDQSSFKSETSTSRVEVPDGTASDQTSGTNWIADQTT